MPGPFSRPPWIGDPDMHRGTCVTHVPSCMPGSLTSGFLWSRWRGKRSTDYKRRFYPKSKCTLSIFLPIHMHVNVRKLRGTIVSIIQPPRVSFYRREIYFTAASFIFTTASFMLPPRDLFYYREFYFIAASFILLPRVLFYCREFCFTAATLIFTTASFIFFAASFILLPRVLFSRKISGQ